MITRQRKSREKDCRQQAEDGRQRPGTTADARRAAEEGQGRGERPAKGYEGGWKEGSGEGTVEAPESPAGSATPEPG